MSTYDVAIIGGGPAGLTAAAELARDSSLNVVVLERESEAGGIPRHSDHPGYGIRDMKTFIGGPAYARRLVREAAAAGAAIRTATMVTGWAGDRSLELTSPDGRERLDARAVILATGARERARPARMIPGDRPGGIYTTGQLQNTVHLQHRSVGKRAVIVGAELVSYSAVLTLKHAGCETALMTSEYPSPESYAMFNIAGRTPLMNVEVATTTRVTRIIGKGVVVGVEVENTRTGQRRIVACDTVVFTGDWIPDHELARSAGLDMDPNSLGPVVDTALRTSREGCSRSAICCTRWTPPTSPRSTAVTWPRRCVATSTVRPPRTRRSASRPRPRCAGSPRACCGRAIPHPRGIGCCCGPTAWCASRKWLRAKMERSSAARPCRGRPHPAGCSGCRPASSTRSITAADRSAFR